MGGITHQDVGDPQDVFSCPAYGRRLTLLSLRNTLGNNGYAIQNMYNFLEGINDDSDNDTVTTPPQDPTSCHNPAPV